MGEGGRERGRERTRAGNKGVRMSFAQEVQKGDQKDKNGNVLKKKKLRGSEFPFSLSPSLLFFLTLLLSSPSSLSREEEESRAPCPGSARAPERVHRRVSKGSEGGESCQAHRERDEFIFPNSSL